jgi:hypothetical protein
MSPLDTTPAHVHIQIDGPWLSVGIASLALLFTIGSFWWLNARQGRLKSSEPQSFAACRTPDKLRLLFPLVLYNSGATPIVVQDMQLSFPLESRWKVPLPWTTTRSKLPPPDGGLAFPAVFSIPGRTAQQMFIEFGGAFPDVTPLARDYRVQIDVKVVHRKQRKHLVTFTLRAAHITHPERYITYSNSPHDLTEETIRESKAALERVISRLQAQP